MKNVIMGSDMENPCEIKLKTVESIIKNHTDILNTMKANRIICIEENCTDAELHACDDQIRLLAGILSDLNRAIS